jgi:hypothetical protein
MNNLFVVVSLLLSLPSASAGTVNLTPGQQVQIGSTRVRCLEEAPTPPPPPETYDCEVATQNGQHYTSHGRSQWEARENIVRLCHQDPPESSGCGPHGTPDCSAYCRGLGNNAICR